MTDVLLPAGIGAVGGLAYGTAQKLDPTSAVLGGTAAALLIAGFVQIAKKEESSPAFVVAMPLSMFTWIAYDRWHDGLWPFTDLERQKEWGYYP